jgi:hypothetical protein
MILIVNCHFSFYEQEFNEKINKKDPKEFKKQDSVGPACKKRKK